MSEEITCAEPAGTPARRFGVGMLFQRMKDTLRSPLHIETNAFTAADSTCSSRRSSVCVLDSPMMSNLRKLDSGDSMNTPTASYSGGVNTASPSDDAKIKPALRCPPKPNRNRPAVFQRVGCTYENGIFANATNSPKTCLDPFQHSPKDTRRKSDEPFTLSRLAKQSLGRLVLSKERIMRGPESPMKENTAGGGASTPTSSSLCAMRTAHSSQCHSRYEAEFVEISEIGRGSFGTVYKAKNKLDHQIYAVKQVRSSEKLEHRLNEVRMLARCGFHNNIVKYYGSWVEGRTLFVQTEFCDGGSVATCFPVGSRAWSEKDLRNLLRQLAKALQHMHDLDVVHLDVKMENVYVKTKKGGQVTFLLGDFGMARCADGGLPDTEGDGRYLCPYLLAEEPGCEQYLRQVDVFALGASIYELARGRPLPLRGEEWRQLRQGGSSSSSPYHHHHHLGHLPGMEVYSPALQQLVAEMLHPSPPCRPSCDEILAILRQGEDSGTNTSMGLGIGDGAAMSPRSCMNGVIHHGHHSHRLHPQHQDASEDAMMAPSSVNSNTMFLSDAASPINYFPVPMVSVPSLVVSRCPSDFFTEGGGGGGNQNDTPSSSTIHHPEPLTLESVSGYVGGIVGSKAVPIFGAKGVALACHEDDVGFAVSG